MKVTYRDEAGGERRLTLGLGGVWSGDDPALADTLNTDVLFVEWIGRFDYYPTPWHKAKAVADKLGGEVDEPEPEFEQGDIPGKVFG